VEHYSSFLEQIDQLSHEDDCLSTLFDDSFSMQDLNINEMLGRPQPMQISVLSKSVISTEQELID